MEQNDRLEKNKDFFQGKQLLNTKLLLIKVKSGEVKIYYGAADTVEAVATANVDYLLSLCLQ